MGNKCESWMNGENDIIQCRKQKGHKGGHTGMIYWDDELEGSSP